MAKIAINGLGRIGRAAFKIISDTPGMELAGINDLIPADNLAYLLQYDSVYGKWDRLVRAEGDSLIVKDNKYRIFSEKDPSKLPWAQLGIDLVLECSGKFTSREGMENHLKAGAKKVLLSTTAKDADIPTVVYGTNEAPIDAKMVSASSCTTNCITPVIEVMRRRIGIKKAIMTTIHAYTSSQALVDGPNKKMRRGRAAGINLVPTNTGAAVATTRILPELEGKFNGVAMRAPVATGSVADIVIVTERPTTVEEVNKIFIEESESSRYKGILGVTCDPIVSSDIIGDSRASIFDLELTQIVGDDLVKVFSWYDNEWGYVNQLIRLAKKLTGS